jgi:hypothetical protein
MQAFELAQQTAICWRPLLGKPAPRPAEIQSHNSKYRANKASEKCEIDKGRQSLLRVWSNGANQNGAALQDPA